MEDADLGQVDAAPAAVSAGATLKAARERKGLSLAEVGSRTRVPLRHLEAIEIGDYNALPSPTYATGFAKAYARAVGADEVAVATAVRGDLDRLGRRKPEYTPYEIADPARVPSRGVAVIGAGIALAILILVGLLYGTNLFRGGSASTATPEASFTPTVAAAPRPAPAPTPAVQQVTLTASDQVWLRVYDGNNATLFEGTMKPGDKFDVPANANNPMINVGRPDKLAVTLNGSAVPALGDGARPIKDVPVSGAAIAARASGQPAPAAAPATAGATPVLASGPATLGTAAPVTAPATPPAHTARAASTHHEHKASKPAAKPRRHLTETQRANLASAAHPPPPAEVP